jgi:hypothetical protein
LQYTQNELDFGQLGGAHHFDFVDIDWRTAYSRTTQNIPDWRITNRVLQEDGRAVALQRQQWRLTHLRRPERASDRFAPRLHGAVQDVAPRHRGVVGTAGKFKFGPAYSYRKRDSSLRIFNFSFQPSFIDLDPTLPFDEFYGP